ncbi:MAG TPA: hypothetical protein DIT49_02945 [Clostridiales bacterium]|nr:hypothetical protein [Clostridiales bacterium]
MLFTKHIEPCCGYCQHAAPLEESTVICVKRGVVSAHEHCRRFRYDPLRRTPPRPKTVDFSHLKEEDFAL